jgi:hypothetical protein
MFKNCNESADESIRTDFSIFQEGPGQKEGTEELADVSKF